MSLALVINSGQVERVGAVTAGEQLLVREGATAGLDVDVAGVLAIAAAVTATSVTLGTGTAVASITIGGATSALSGAGALILGRVGAEVEILGDLRVGGNEIVVGTTTFQGNTQIGDALTDTLEIQATILNNSLAGAPISLLFDGTVDHALVPATAAVDTAGVKLTISGAIGGVASAVGGGAGGDAVINGGPGGNGAGGFNAGAGGLVESGGGNGGDSDGTGTAGVGGAATIFGGDGGSGSGAINPGNGGALSIMGGNAGGGGGNDANGGAVSIDAGTASGAGVEGLISIGTTTASTITIGAVANPTTLFGKEVLTPAQARDLAATAAGAAGALTVGVDITALTNSAPANGALQTVLDALDASIGAGGATLQTAYDAGPDITQDATGGIEITRGALSADTHTLSLVSLQDEGNPILTVNKAPATAGAGNAATITTGANASGAALFVNNLGSGNALDVQDGGSPVLVVNGAGAVAITPTSGQGLTETLLGVGAYSLSAVTGSIDIANSSGGAVAGDITIASAAGGGGTSGNIAIATSATGGTSGGVAIGAGAALSPPAAGGVSLQATTGGITGTVTSTGVISLSTVTGSIDISNSAAGAVASDISITSLATSGTSGNIALVTRATGGGTHGGAAISAGVAIGAPAAGAVTVDAAAGVSIDAAAASNFSVTGAGLTLSTITSGTLLLSGAALVDIDAAANLDVDVTGTMDFLSTGAFSIDGTGASNVTATSGALTISTLTTGNVVIGSAADVDVDGANLLLDATAGVSIDAATASNLTVSGATADLTLGARATTITLNESGDTALVGFTATSIIGALNELLTGRSNLLTVDATVNATTGINAGEAVALDDQAGVPRAFQADANGGTELENAFGLALATAGTGAAIVIVTGGETDIPDAAWTGGVPGTGDVGKVFFMTDTPGLVSLTAPVGSSRVLKLGIISRGGSGAVRGVVGVPDSIKL